MRPLSRLRLWKRNYWNGDVAAIAASISRFGFNGCLCCRGQEVVAGNHTVLALRQLKAEGVVVSGVEVRGGDWLVACVNVSHLSEAEAVAFAIAHNRIPFLGSADTTQLLQLLQELRESEGLAATGFSENDIAAMAKAMKKADATSDFPEPDATTNHKCPSCGFEWQGGCR